MPFPKSKRVIFRNNPLKEVICQLRYPTILKVAASNPADFQEEIRQAYPVYQDEVSAKLPAEIVQLLERAAARGVGPNIVDEITHRFSSEDGRYLISLTQEFLAITDYQYKKWEQFKQEIIRAKTAFESIYRPSYYSRIGLRYQNHIDKRVLGLENSPWKECLRPECSGVLAANNVGQQLDEFRCVSKVRLTGVDESYVQLRYGLNEKDESGQSFIIDADYFTTGKRDPNHVIEVLESFNAKSGNVFRWFITKPLRDALEPEDV